MAFDDCTAYPATREQARESMQRSMRWALRSYDHYYRDAAARRGICSASCRAACTRICGCESLEALSQREFAGLCDRRPGRRGAGGGAAARARVP